MKPPHFNTVWEYDYSLTPGKGMSLLHVFQIQKEHKMCREALSTVIQRYNNVQKLNMPLKTTKEFLSFHLIYLPRNPLLSFLFITYCIYRNSRFSWANLSWNTYAINLVCLKYVFFKYKLLSPLGPSELLHKLILHDGDLSRKTTQMRIKHHRFSQSIWGFDAAACVSSPTMPPSFRAA